MNLLIALYRYFPFGGLQKDMLNIAHECAERGHRINIFCQSWAGDYPQHQNIEVNVVPDRPAWWQGRSNHKRNQRFDRQLKTAVEKIRPDLLVGFNKIPGIDVYYAADTCFKAKLCEERPWFLRLLPRYRSFVRSEEAVFSTTNDSQILAIAKNAIDEYQRYYQTANDRFTLLPPGIGKDRVNLSGTFNRSLHKELLLNQGAKIVLMVGSGFRTKGVDRAIKAVASLPEALKKNTHLVIAGEDNAQPFRQLSNEKNISQQVHFLGGRGDIPELLKSADLLIHPARRENTGTVLLEAAVSMLPVLTVDVCGYSHYIADNRLGRVIASPFDQSVLNKNLEEMLSEDIKQKESYRKDVNRFATEADIYDMPLRAAETIEKIYQQQRGAT